MVSTLGVRIPPKRLEAVIQGEGLGSLLGFRVLRLKVIVRISEDPPREAFSLKVRVPLAL